LKNSLLYYSTNNRSPEIPFKDALLKGLAPDGGLYMPKTIPVLTAEELDSFSGKPYHEIAFVVLSKFLGDEINEHDLIRLCRDAYNFEVPIEKVDDERYILRLDHGPTASFKDFAARMMSRLMQYFLSANDQHISILTATSGDTGSAVANAFFGLGNIDVIILFPGNEVTIMQRKQMTTLNGNIRVIELNGKFDDCQSLVKRAFNDSSFSHIPLSSANSINIGRLLPQSVYYFYAWSRLTERKRKKIAFSVPSGNFGNLMGGLIAREMGLPVEKFIISTNENDEVPEFLNNGFYRPVQPSRKCISSAMNVGHPSNLSRIIALYGGKMDEKGNILAMPDLDRMRKDFFAVSVSDRITEETIWKCCKQNHVLLEPHGAVAWFGLGEYIRCCRKDNTRDTIYVSLETAHPAKFPDELKKIINANPALPDSLAGLSHIQEIYVSMENDFRALKEFITECCGKK
jgi:threonine synthase